MKGEFYMIDLHIHTTNSDGYYTVKEIPKMAEEKILIQFHFVTIMF